MFDALRHRLRPSLSGALDDAHGSPWLRTIATVLVASLLLTVSAKVSIPMWPVPITLQTLVVTCLGLVLGPRLSALVVLAYLAQGAAGLPVFAGTPANGLGVAYMTGPTGGYLAGFLVAAPLIGLLARRGWGRSFAGTLAALTVGHVVIFACGLAWLGRFTGYGAELLTAGLTPFLLGGIAKVLVGATLVPQAWRWAETATGPDRIGPGHDAHRSTDGRDA